MGWLQRKVGLHGWPYFHLWLRAAICGVIVIGASVVCTVLVFNDQVSSLQQALSLNPRIKLRAGTLTSAYENGPQTILLVGDDRRPPTASSGPVLPHSNEMLLVRVDPSQSAITMLSIPRDLKVTIYPHDGPSVVRRFNVAYTLGGIELMTETIKRVLGLSVNHVAVITFPRFKRAVDEMGCAYSTVDRRYLHSNAGLPASMTYSEINLQPGYQKLCGRSALQFVSYRHGDTALVRDARDQRFLLDVKKQYGPTLLYNAGKFERIFGRAVQTDIHGRDQILDLLHLMVSVAGKPVRQVQFPVTLGPIYVTSTPQQIRAAANDFLHGAVAKQPRSTTPQGQGGPQPANAHPHRARGRQTRSKTVQLQPTSKATLSSAAAASRRLPIALEYPHGRSQFGSARDSLRIYHVKDQGGRAHSIYNVSVDRGLMGEFYDVQGTDWANPPLLSKPDRVVTAGNRQYQLYYHGSKLNLVAWRENGGTYWVINTLTDSIPATAMLALAHSTLPVGKTTAGPIKRGAVPKAVKVQSRRQGLTIGGVAAIAGLVAFVLMALLAIYLLRTQREIKALRMRIQQSRQL